MQSLRGAGLRTEGVHIRKANQIGITVIHIAPPLASWKQLKPSVQACTPLCL